MELVDAALSQSAGVSDEELFRARIAVCGIGGGGSNTIQRISKMGVRGASLIAINTDGKHLNTLDANIRRILVGGALTRGLGAGGFPEVANKAAQYSRTELESALTDYNLVFITAGMGGGTGTGAAPVVAEIAKRAGAVVIGIVTFPFSLERVRIDVARRGIEELRRNIDTLIVIDNQRLVDLYPNVAMEQAFKIADEVASRAVRGITETINLPSLINLDYADVKNVMSSGGLAMISVGEGKGSNKVDDVVNDTLKNKLLDVDYEGATSVLIHITGGEDMTLGEANEVARRLTAVTSPNASVVWGARIDPSYSGKIEVIAIFTGVKSSSIMGSNKDEGREDFGLGSLQF
ncbi:MAG: cell division protein FtsZ [Candidatus Marsarchaeota archaeon]|jgi:cell division protein FtsZ|nr:cell division protein FtsZ [Candidatus Marsarchaeota archaeon]MCL5111608.1 cell division protein FtsZ [Candidatus Marsarchaeota archaeon]